MSEQHEGGRAARRRAQRAAAKSDRRAVQHTYDPTAVLAQLAVDAERFDIGGLVALSDDELAVEAGMVQAARDVMSSNAPLKFDDFERLILMVSATCLAWADAEPHRTREDAFDMMRRCGLAVQEKPLPDTGTADLSIGVGDDTASFGSAAMIIVNRIALKGA